MPCCVPMWGRWRGWGRRSAWARLKRATSSCRGTKEPSLYESRSPTGTRPPHPAALHRSNPACASRQWCYALPEEHRPMILDENAFDESIAVAKEIFQRTGFPPALDDSSLRVGHFASWYGTDDPDDLDEIVGLAVP